MDRIKVFLWHCAGASVPMLKRCPIEGPKYVSLGATILFTGILAALSAAYAFHFIFSSPYIATLLGILWGAMIFNLDRFIVLSMRKSDRGYKEVIQAIPRFILAILIAIVISKPLEIKIFEKEISSELGLIKQEVLQDNRARIKIKYSDELDSLKNEMTNLQADMANKTAKRDELLTIARMEADGTGGSGKVNPGPIYNIKKDNADQAQAELENLRLKHERTTQLLELRAADLNGRLDKELAELEDVNVFGLSYQLLALDRIGDKYAPIAYADWFIVLLFICIEISPILTKLISKRGPYDELLEVREHYYRNYKEEKITMSDLALSRKLSQV